MDARRTLVRSRPKLAASLASLVAGAAVAGVAVAKPATYRYDAVHSQVLFFASHLGYSHSMGRFPGLSGRFTYDPDDPAAAKVDATIAIASLYLGDAAWEKKMLGRDFFAAKEHPTARFVATRWSPAGADRGTLSGELTLRGITRPVTLAVTVNRVGRHSYSLQHVAGFSASATIKRSDFGMRRLLPAVGDEVEIRLEIEGIRTDDADAARGDASDADLRGQ